MAKKIAASSVRKKFILDTIEELRSKGSAHRSIRLKELEMLFKHEFGDTLEETLDEMVQATELIVIAWVQSDQPYSRRIPKDAHIFGAFPDPNFPDDKDPCLYPPNQLTRQCVRFAYRSPTLSIRRVIEAQRTRMEQDKIKRREERWGRKSAS